MTDAPRPAKRPATIKDVARELGVSVATVSYALNGRGTIGDELRARVREVAARVGYRPNRLAQAVRTGRTMSIGLLVPDLNNPFYPALAQAVERAARGAGYSVVLIDTAGFDDEGDAVRQIESHIAGAVWCQMAREDRGSEDFQVPLVVIGLPQQDIDSVTADDRLGGALLAEHLLGLGHRRVGILAGAAVPDGMDDRRAAFIERFSRDGEVVWDVKAPYSIDLPDTLSAQIARRDVTAVMCGNDQIAIGLLRMAKRLGIAVPGELSVVGFDDIPWASIVSPELTTIRQPVADMAVAAVEMLLARVSDPVREATHLKVGVALVERESTRRV